MSALLTEAPGGHRPCLCNVNLIPVQSLINTFEPGAGGTHLWSQLLERLRQEGHLSLGLWSQHGSHSEALSLEILIKQSCIFIKYR